MKILSYKTSEVNYVSKQCNWIFELKSSRDIFCFPCCLISTLNYLKPKNYYPIHSNTLEIFFAFINYCSCAHKKKITASAVQASTKNCTISRSAFFALFCDWSPGTQYIKYGKLYTIIKFAERFVLGFTRFCYICYRKGRNNCKNETILLWQHDGNDQQ